MSHSPIVVPLDFPSAAAADSFVDLVVPQDCRLKVGKELFTREGPQYVKELVRRGFDVFLDLKFHDIPNTTAQAVLAAADLGVWMVNIHCSGGRNMMDACRKILTDHGHDTLLIGVTVLTSMEQSELPELGITCALADQVVHLAQLAKLCGLDGVVCSAQEAKSLREQLGADFKLVTPGIRPAGADANDQKRIVTPQQAMEWGSDYLVIGRPITQADDPKVALNTINASLK